MERAGSHPGVLRLVHPDRGADTTSSRGRDSAPRTSRQRVPVRKGDEQPAPGRTLRVPARHVEQENRSAATLSPDDARWILARMAGESIEGGRAAILRPEVRARLVATGERLGLRAFDANLILAIVQDDARSRRVQGDDKIQGNDKGHPHSGTLASRLGLVRPAIRPAAPSIRSIWLRLALAFTAGGSLAALAIRWLQS